MRAWLTPAETPAQRACLALEFPDSEAWRAIVEGALLNLADESNWEPSGAVTVEEAAAEGFRIYQEAAEAVGACVPVGGILVWASNDIPDGWLLCDGELYAAADYPRLFDRLGYYWGGSGDNFRVPQLQYLFLRGAIGESMPLGDLGGEASHTLTIQEMPAHAHQTHYHQGYVPIGELVPGAAGTIVSWEGNSVGGGLPHNNEPPYIAMHFIIRAR